MRGARARRLVFWPGLGADIDNFVRKCAPRQTHAYQQQSEPLLIRPVREHAWYRVGVDILDYGGKAYLCAYDALSNFPCRGGTAPRHMRRKCH